MKIECIDVDYRQRPRVNKQQKISLYKANFRIGIAYTENVSDNGMYIKTNGLIYPPESMLEIAYLDDSRTYCLLAKIVHRNRDGIGVKFV